MTTVVPPTDDWVDAAPFRAHLRHVADTSGQPWQVLAMQAGVSLALADHLLHGRRGRPVRRITRASAARLLALTATRARALPTEWVPVDRARQLLQGLSVRGWSPASIAAASGVELRALRNVHRPDAHHIGYADELRLLVLVAVLDRVAAQSAA